MVTRSFHDALWPGASGTDIGDLPQISGLLDDAKSLQKLFDVIGSACDCFGYHVLVAELVFFSDYVEYPYEVSATRVRSVTARVKPMFSLLPSSTSSAPYYRAFQKMIVRQPIGGHPNLWGEWEDKNGKNWPRIGYIAFSNAETYPATGAPLAALSKKDSDLKIATFDKGDVPLEKYSESAEYYFKEFIDLIIEEAEAGIEQMPAIEQNAAELAITRLKASSFVSMAVGRIRPTSNRKILGALQRLGLSGTRGLQLLLFVEPNATAPAKVPDIRVSRDKNNQDVDRISCSLHKLLMEMIHDESNTISEELANLISLQHVLIHNSSGLFHAVNPDEIALAIASGNEQFFGGNWDCDLVTLEGFSDDARKRKIQAVLQRVIKSIQVAKRNLRVLELRLKSKDIQFESSDLQLEDKEFFEHVVQLCQSLFVQDTIEIDEDTNVRNIIVPAGYINLDFLIPVVYEILQNFRRYGSRYEKLKLAVSKVRNGDSYQFDFSNRCESALRPTSSKYEGFLREVTIDHLVEQDRYIQRLTLHPFAFENELPVSLRGKI